MELFGNSKCYIPLLNFKILSQITDKALGGGGGIIDYILRKVKAER